MNIKTLRIQLKFKQSGFEGRIVGGQPADDGQFPYVVALRTQANVHLCGGTIISVISFLLHKKVNQILFLYNNFTLQ